MARPRSPKIRIGRRRSRSTHTPAGSPIRMNGRNSIVPRRPIWNALARRSRIAVSGSASSVTCEPSWLTVSADHSLMKSRWRHRLLTGRRSLGPATALLLTSRRLPAQSRIFGPREGSQRDMHGTRSRGPFAFGACGISIDHGGEALTELDQFVGREMGLEAEERARLLPDPRLLRLSRQILRKDPLLDRDPLATP